MADSVSMAIRKNTEEQARLKTLADTARSIAEIKESIDKLFAAVGLLSAKLDSIQNEIAPKPTKAVR